MNLYLLSLVRDIIVVEFSLSPAPHVPHPTPSPGAGFFFVSPDLLGQSPDLNP